MEYLYAFVVALPLWLAIALKVGVIVGLVGSLLEEIGKRFSLFRLIAVGQQIEAIAVDVPKFVSRIRGWDLPGIVDKFRKKAPSALVLCLALACAPALSGCAWFNSKLPTAEKCLPTPAALAGQVAMILAGGGDYVAKLEALAQTDGAATVLCAVQAFLSTHAPAASEYSEPRERALNYIELKGAK